MELYVPVRRPAYLCSRIEPKRRFLPRTDLLRWRRCWVLRVVRMSAMSSPSYSARESSQPMRSA